MDVVVGDGMAILKKGGELDLLRKWLSLVRRTRRLVLPHSLCRDGLTKQARASSASVQSKAKQVSVRDKSWDFWHGKDHGLHML